MYSSEPFDVGVRTSSTPSAFGDTTTTAAVGRHDDPIRLFGIRDTDFGARQPAIGEGGGGPVGQRGAGFVERGGQHPALGDAGQEPVLLVVGRQVEQRQHAEAQRGQRRRDGAVAAHFGQHRRDLGQTHTVAAEAFGHRQRRHPTVDQRVPGVVPVEHGRDHIGDSLLLSQ